ncbi:Glycoside hydrolase family 18, catalytic domain [Dillenia turbinata]|uniref:Glycoside hydrolase family 18, catalytic domain n=1 Tax=Dillenia turbinata TaxID=194707 RepID=A0AAN8VCQ6_9MAGN
MIKHYNIDGIDIDYEHYITDPETFTECIGKLITTLKKSDTISFATIAPYDDKGPVQSHYLELWRKFGHVIDYVNFQFYAYDRIGVSQFVKYFNEKASNYKGGQILASFVTGSDGGGLSPDDGFFEACNELIQQGKLGGIFVWCVDESKRAGFPNEKKSQDLQAAPANSNLFTEYIGAEFNNVRFSDVPINPNVDFHFILAFAIDYTTSSPSPTNGKFNIFWDSDNLGPSQVSSIKSQHPNVKVALSLGGDSVGDGHAYFRPSSIDSWVSNAVSSLTSIIRQYNLDGIDIDYEHFQADPKTFAECIGRLIKTLKNNRVIQFASIAPFNDDQVQSHYQTLWHSYGHLIDYVNFQFYAYDKGTTVSQFMKYFADQSSNYNGGKVLVSFISDGSGGLSPDNGFFTACSRLKSQQQLHDYTTSASALPTNGKFNVFWDSINLSPAQVASIKRQHPNVKVCLSLGGDTVRGEYAFFQPSSVGSWVANAVSSLTAIIKQYHLDGIDVDYEHFKADPNTFAQCIGQLITTLKRNNVISLASIAPYDDDVVQSHYLALWRSYGDVIDYVNFQFYAYPRSTTVPQFLSHFKTQTSNYTGGKVLVSFSTDSSGGLKPGNGFFKACNELKSQNQLHGIFVWSADTSKAMGFRYEKQSQALLAS